MELLLIYDLYQAHMHIHQQNWTIKVFSIYQKIMYWNMYCVLANNTLQVLKNDKCEEFYILF